MDSSTTSPQIDEAAWIKAYIEVTGATESEARNVFMYIGDSKVVTTGDECVPDTNGSPAEIVSTAEPFKPS